MVWINVSFPDDEEVLAEKSFRTYRNYLKSIEFIIKNYYGSNLLQSLKDTILKNKFPSNKQQSNLDIDKIKKLLFNSWHSEIILNLPNKFDASLKLYSNHWAPVQAYYSIYLSLRALIEAMGINCREDHTTTLSLVASWIKNDALFLVPWNIYCKGCTEYKNHKFYGLPNAYNVKEISTLTNPSQENMWDFYCLMLKTTRERILNKRKVDWKRKNNRKRIKKDEIFAIDRDIHPTTFFDCMFRLRIRSNYEDADAFMMGTQTPQDASSYHDTLILLTRSTLFVIETYISYLLGKDRYKNLVEDFKKRDSLRQSEKTVKEREEIIFS